MTLSTAVLHFLAFSAAYIVIASQRVANARPMTSSAKQSSAASEGWIASSQELLAMTMRHG
jgi:hypothetical protein